MNNLSQSQALKEFKLQTQTFMSVTEQTLTALRTRIDTNESAITGQRQMLNDLKKYLSLNEDQLAALKEHFVAPKADLLDR